MVLIFCQVGSDNLKKKARKGEVGGSVCGDGSILLF